MSSFGSCHTNFYDCLDYIMSLTVVLIVQKVNWSHSALPISDVQLVREQGEKWRQKKLAKSEAPFTKPLSSFLLGIFHAALQLTDHLEEADSATAAYTAIIVTCK